MCERNVTHNSSSDDSNVGCDISQFSFFKKNENKLTWSSFVSTFFEIKKKIPKWKIQLIMCRIMCWWQLHCCPFIYFSSWYNGWAGNCLSTTEFIFSLMGKWNVNETERTNVCAMNFLIFIFISSAARVYTNGVLIAYWRSVRNEKIKSNAEAKAKSYMVYV